MYTDSLVAFLDILGFSERIRETEIDDSKAQPIADMLNGIQNIITIINRRAKANWKTKFTVRGFSDSIVISCPKISRQALIFMAHVVATFQFTTMRRKFFLRGGISAGGHYEKEGVSFGPAFLKAYEMEKLSVWPRVLIDPLVFRRLNPETVNNALESYISRDPNGLCYLNYLHLLLAQEYLRLEDNQIAVEDIPRLNFGGTLNKHKIYVTDIVEQLKASNRLDLLPKYHAVADFHNRYVEEIYRELPIQDNYNKVDPNTVTGKIINEIKMLASSRKATETEDVDALLSLYTKTLSQDRQRFQEYKIDLASLFEPLYLVKRQ